MESYFQIFAVDKVNMLSVMVDNMSADLRAGYNPDGVSITDQMREIANYATRFAAEMLVLAETGSRDREKKCRLDLYKRGVIG